MIHGKAATRFSEKDTKGLSILTYNPTILQQKNIRRYTDWTGKDFGATIDKSGNIYFISDEANGQYNLYTFDNNKKTH